jgi:hypothetical protein
MPVCRNFIRMMLTDPASTVRIGCVRNSDEFDAANTFGRVVVMDDL